MDNPVFIKPLVWETPNNLYYKSGQYHIENYDNDEKFNLYITLRWHSSYRTLKEAKAAAFVHHEEFINNSIEYLEKDFSSVEKGNKLLYNGKNSQYFTNGKVYEVAGKHVREPDQFTDGFCMWHVIDDEGHEHHWDDRGAFNHGFRKV